MQDIGQNFLPISESLNVRLFVHVHACADARALLMFLPMPIVMFVQYEHEN